MSEIPFWALSPSPITIMFYFILALYATKKLLKIGKYKRFRHLVAFTDAILILGFIVVSLDTLWIVVCGLRFGWFYPDSVMQLIFCALRNVAALIFCYLFVGSYFQKRIVNLVNAHWAFTLNTLFLVLWFGLSPTPAYTDWTFAIRHNYPTSTILTSFLLSHIIGKSLVATIFILTFQQK